MKPSRLAIGCDLVEVKRITKLRRSAVALRRLFRPGEDITGSNEHLAGLIAAKEAAIKAFGLPIGSWRVIEITKAVSGQPHIKIHHPQAKRWQSVEVSISHDDGFALAVVVALANHK